MFGKFVAPVKEKKFVRITACAHVINILQLHSLGLTTKATTFWNGPSKAESRLGRSSKSGASRRMARMAPVNLRTVSAIPARISATESKSSDRDNNPVSSSVNVVNCCSVGQKSNIISAHRTSTNERHPFRHSAPAPAHR